MTFCLLNIIISLQKRKLKGSMTFIRRLFIMKKNKKGFTLIELLVVVAIIGILAGLLIPGLMNKTVDAKIKTANSNAKLVYSSTANVLQQGAIDEATWLPTAAAEAFAKDGANIEASNIKTLTDAVQNELRSGFKGNWYVSVNANGDVEYALWSKGTAFATKAAQLSDEDIKKAKGKTGCYPAK